MTVDAYPDGPNDPEQATMMAAWLQDTYGWSQWECYGIRPAGLGRTRHGRLDPVVAGYAWTMTGTA